MVKENTEKKIEKLIFGMIENYGFELVDVQYQKEGSNWYLRIFIDKDDGIDLDDCEYVSKNLEVLLDAEDIIRDSYILEVSSPGIERPLKYEKDFIRFIGEMVVVKTYKAIKGQKAFKGFLQGIEGQNVIIKDGLESYRLPLNDISHAHVAVDF